MNDSMLPVRSRTWKPHHDRVAVLVVVLLAWLAACSAAGDEIAAEAKRFGAGVMEPEPSEVVDHFLVPFSTADRGSFKTVAVVSVFGAPRQSYKKGHIHTGLDLVPKQRVDGLAQVQVLPMAPGVVCSVHLGAPHLTVVIKHRLPDGSALYTSYKHLAQAFVAPGEQVQATTPLGRLFTRKETKELGGNYDHLHLEVRKAFDDQGTASWLTMTQEDLAKRFFDPLVFMKERLGKDLVPAKEKASVLHGAITSSESPS